MPVLTRSLLRELEESIESTRDSVMKKVTSQTIFSTAMNYNKAWDPPNQMICGTTSVLRRSLRAKCPYVTINEDHLFDEVDELAYIYARVLNGGGGGGGC